MLLSKCSIGTIEKGNASLSLHRAETSIYLFSIILERSKNDALEVELFAFLSCNSKGYIILKFLSNSRWSYLAHKSSIR